MRQGLYRFEDGRLKPVGQTNFPEARLRERRDLQRILREQIELVAPDVLIIAEEFGEWDDSRRRIDLLGLDKRANLVVIELKRTNDGGHMELQALRYAAMASTMTFDQAVDAYERFLETRKESKDSRQTILEFLGWDEPDERRFAQDVRIVLVSADFSKELTSTVLWLNERQLDIRCVRLRPYSDSEGLLVDIQQIIPLPEAVDYQIAVRRKAGQERAGSGRKWNEQSVMNELGARHGSTIADVASALLKWAEPRVSYIWWGEGETVGSFVATVNSGGDKYYLFRVSTKGLVEVWFDRLTKRPDLDQGSVESFRDGVSKIPGVELCAGASRPKFSLAVLQDANAMTAFQQARERLLEAIGSPRQ